jgi:hypothetical protein
MAGFDSSEYYRLLNHDPIAAHNYLDAARLGHGDPSRVAEQLGSIIEEVEASRAERLAQEFVAQHPEFPQEIPAARALDKRIAEYLQNGYPTDMHVFNAAYRDLLAEGVIKPEKENEQETVTETASAATRHPEENFENMTDTQLREYAKQHDLIDSFTLRHSGF